MVTDTKTFSRFGFWYPFVVFATSLIIVVLVSTIPILYGIDPNKNQDLVLIINSLLFILFGVGSWIGWKAKGIKLSEVFSFKGISTKTLLIIGASSVLLQPLFLIVTLILNSYAGIEIQGNSGEITQGSLSLVKVLAIILIAPLLEEVFFRGLLFDGFLNTLRKFIPVKDSIRVYLTVAFTSILFGLMHLSSLDLSGLFSVVTTTLLGAAFAIMRIRTGSLFLPVFSHFLFNLTGLGFIALALSMGV
jgi:membrane protease YdiL (CAAX protease family)